MIFLTPLTSPTRILGVEPALFGGVGVVFFLGWLLFPQNLVYVIIGTLVVMCCGIVQRYRDPHFFTVLVKSFLITRSLNTKKGVYYVA